MGNTDADWISWGKNDPYFGVVTEERFNRKNIAENHAVFMQGGTDYVANLMAHIERHFGTFPQSRALDFGCGVGRLTLPLALHFEEVVGLDIAPAMLSEARANANERNNVTFELSDENLSNAKGKFDLVHTYIVLQHIPVEKGMRIIREMLSRVSENGLASLHFAIARDGGSMAKLRYWARCRFPGAQMISNLIRRRPIAEPLMQMNEYPVDQVLRLFEDYGFHRGTTKLERHYNVLTLRLVAQRGS